MQGPTLRAICWFFCPRDCSFARRAGSYRQQSTVYGGLKINPQQAEALYQPYQGGLPAGLVRQVLRFGLVRIDLYSVANNSVFLVGARPAGENEKIARRAGSYYRCIDAC